MDCNQKSRIVPLCGLQYEQNVMISGPCRDTISAYIGASKGSIRCPALINEREVLEFCGMASEDLFVRLRLCSETGFKKRFSRATRIIYSNLAGGRDVGGRKGLSLFMGSDALRCQRWR